MSVSWSAVIGRSGTEYSKLSREQTRTFFRGYRVAAQGVRTRTCEVNGWGANMALTKGGQSLKGGQ